MQLQNVARQQVFLAKQEVTLSITTRMLVDCLGRGHHCRILASYKTWNRTCFHQSYIHFWNKKKPSWSNFWFKGGKEDAKSNRLSVPSQKAMISKPATACPNSQRQITRDYYLYTVLISKFVDCGFWLKSLHVFGAFDDRQLLRGLLLIRGWLEWYFTLDQEYPT